MSDFKVGDRVVSIGLPIKWYGVVVEIEQKNTFTYGIPVKWDDIDYSRREHNYSLAGAGAIRKLTKLEKALK